MPPKKQQKKLKTKSKRYSCELCTNIDNNQMAECVECHSKYHLKCIGIQKIITGNEWLCPICVVMMKNESRLAIKNSLKTSKLDSTKKDQTIIPELSSNNVKQVDTTVSHVDNQAAENCHAEGSQSQGRINANAEIDGNRTSLENGVPKNGPSQSQRSQVSTKKSIKTSSSKRNLELQHLEEMKALLDKRMQMEEKKLEMEEAYLTNKYQILMETRSETVSRKSTDRTSFTREWVQRNEENQAAKKNAIETVAQVHHHPPPTLEGLGSEKELCERTTAKQKVGNDSMPPRNASADHINPRLFRDERKDFFKRIDRITLDGNGEETKQDSLFHRGIAANKSAPSETIKENLITTKQSCPKHDAKLHMFSNGRTSDPLECNAKRTFYNPKQFQTAEKTEWWWDNQFNEPNQSEEQFMKTNWHILGDYPENIDHQRLKNIHSTPAKCLTYTQSSKSGYESSDSELVTEVAQSTRAASSVSSNQRQYHEPKEIFQSFSTSRHQPKGKEQTFTSSQRQPVSSTYRYTQPQVSFAHNTPITSTSNRFDDQPPENMLETTTINSSSLPGLTYNPSIYPTHEPPSPPSNVFTKEQIASRQVIRRKLPEFYGDIRKWTVWYSRYKNTTEKCNYDNSENLDRLEESLKDPARKLVESRLHEPDAVPWIIKTLKKVYGKQEKILKKSIKDLRERPPIKPNQLEALMEFAFEVQSVTATIESLKCPSLYSNPTLMDDIVNKLPPQEKKDWARYKRGKYDVNLKTLSDWLYELAEDLCDVVEPTSFIKEKNLEKKDSARVNVHVNVSDTKTKEAAPEAASTTEYVKEKKVYPCVICNKNCEKVEGCPVFNSYDAKARWKTIKSKKLCKLCLKKHKPPCRLQNDCGTSGCMLRHHRLLHDEDFKGKTPEAKTSAVSNIHCDTTKRTILKFMPVVLHHKKKMVLTIAFLDDGTTVTMMEQSLADELNLSGTPEQLCLMWTRNIHRTEKAERVSLEISGASKRRYPLNGIRTVKNLQLPIQSFKKADLVKLYPYLANIPLDDYEEVMPGIIIGSDMPKLSTQLKVVEGDGYDSPIAIKTRLGWTVFGSTNESTSINHMNHHYVKVCSHHNQLDEEIHQRIKEYFSIENFGVQANIKTELDSKDDRRAIQMLQKLTVKTNGRFETGLLWKQDEINLPDSYPMAFKRMISLEKQGDEIVKKIGDKIADYVAKGYARKLSAEELKVQKKDVWYLPVFGVYHPKKPQKLRMVFDGAAKVKSTSLNSMLLKGPDQLTSIVDILRRLREKKIAVSGDVKEMFHQIKIRKEDQHFQRFLFRNGETNRDPDIYLMQVMTFGATCSPCAAQYVKNTNAAEFVENYPRAVEAIIDNHYVDDMMDGADTIEDAIKLVEDVKMIHSNAGFELRNFLSNSIEVLKAIGDNNPNGTKNIVLDTDLKTERILGMYWNTASDELTFSLKYTLFNEEIFNGSKLPTKRELLRTLMTIYDPLGLLSNYLIHLKILLQDIWRAEINWDEKISATNLVDRWKQWLNLLPGVETVQIPRLYTPKLSNKKLISIQIHTFVDASEDAFSAVSYLRVEDEDGIDCALIGSKARVTPLKYLSIPRKELQAAVLGTRLMTSIIQGQRFKVNRRVIWSDSETVLSWLNSNHRKYSQFVAHRVGEILECTDVSEWRWIPTKENIADEATKWSKSPNFDPSNRWFSGPQFIRLPESGWPKKKKIQVDTEEEMKSHFSHKSFIIPQLVDASRFSKWNYLVRAVANVIRFGKLNKNKSLKGQPLNQDELLKAENLLFRQAQFEGFPSEMVTLERNKTLPLSKQQFIEKPSALFDGSPFLDSEGVLRMKGRIDGARDLPLNSKRPIVLPKDSRITRLIVHQYHVQCFHRNHQTAINEIRQKFYIPRLRVVFKSVRMNCQMCKVKLAKVMEPQMSDLPPARMAIRIRPFSYVGVDYFGPMPVKVGRHTEKRWGVIFTCLTIRAVYLELVPGLDTYSCILCIRKFVSEVGPVIEFHSDCGTNFIGSNNELKMEIEKLNPEQLKTEFTSTYTQWVFNPPAAPHMGGSWEKLIASVKTGIYNSLPERAPKEYMMSSMLKEIQNVINSRPLTYIPLELEDDEALTPNHFLRGSSNGMMAPCKLDLDGPYLRSCWKEAQRLTEIFWQRFIKEYLPTLTRRTKWFKKVKPLQPNDIVLVVDQRNPRNTYPKARIIEVQRGSNNQIRRAKIELITEANVDKDGKICDVRKKNLWRPAHKLALLDVLSRVDEGLANPEEDRETGGGMLQTDVNTDSSKFKLSNSSSTQTSRVLRASSRR